MKNYSPTNQPWHSYKDSITAIEVEEGITNISSYAFYKCVNAETIDLPSTINIIEYSAFDTCKSVKSIEIPCAVSSVTLVPLSAATGQIALTTANVFEEFYKDNKKVVYDWDEIERVKIPYEGAFCDAVPGRFGLTVCDDFASLYPSQVRTCNFSFENFIQKTIPNNIPGLPPVKVPWDEDELAEFRKDPNYFVSVMGNVYRNDRDYAFRRLQKKLKGLRDAYKYTGQKIEAELLTEIDNLLKNL